MQKAYLVLENGKVFEGTSFGAIGNALGELVFTTSMVGYNDLLRDSAYYGQIVVNTFPLIGNYGIVFDDFESKKPYLNGYIVREACENPSNFNCKCTLEDYMKLHGLVGICDIDTRELTKIIRDNGTMNCMICADADNIDSKLKEIKEYKLSILDQLSREDIEEYLDYLSYYEKEGKVYTNDERGKYRKLASLRSFYHYYFTCELIEKDVASLVPMPKLHEKEIIRLDPDEVAILLDAVENGENLTENEKRFHNKTKVRDLALLTLLLGTGIRVSECVGLNIKDVDFKNDGIKIRRKGGAETVVYFGDEVRNALLDYLEDREQSLDVGAIAKGWSTQRVCENLPAGFLVSVGGNVCASGPKPENNTAWVVGIQDPEGGADDYLHTVYVNQESVVTSGDYQRYYTVDGKEYHHIIDPETLYPAKIWKSVSIICTDSGLGDALSTALFLLDLEEGQKLLDKYDAHAVWVDLEGETYYSPGFKELIRT